MLRKLPLVYKYLLSYIIILIIPLLVMGLFVYQHFVDIVKADITASHQHMLKQIRDGFDIKIKEMNKIANEISSKPELTPYQLTKNMYNAMAAKSQLNYTVANDFIHNVILYMHGGKYLYSAGSTHTPKRFIEQIYPYPNWSLSQFLYDMNHLKAPLLRPAEDVYSNDLKNNRALTYIVPIPQNSVAAYGTVLFMIDEQSVKRLLEGVLEAPNGNTLIYNQQGKLITSQHDETYLHTTPFKAAIRSLPENGSRTMEIEDRPYMFSTVKSEMTGWSYVTLIPEDDYLARLHEMKNRSLIALLFIFGLGSAAIYMLMHVNYAPIRRLFTYTGRHYGQKVSNFNEVTQMFDHMTAASALLGQKLQTNKSAMREYWLLNLLKGRIEDTEDFFMRAGEAGLTFSKEMFFVIRIYVRNRSQLPHQSKSLTEHIEEHWPSAIDGYRVELVDEDAMSIICAMDRSETQFKEKMMMLHHRLQDFASDGVTIGIGQPYEEINQVGKSYIEASTALDYKLIKGHNRVIFFDEISFDDRFPQWYPRQEIEMMGVLITQGNTEKGEELVQEILRYIEDHETPLHMVRCICYDMINCIIKAAYSMGMRAEHLEVVDYPDVVALTAFDTIQDLAAIVNDMSTRLCSKIQAHEENTASSLKEQMVGFIQANYHDYHFSVQTMADHFSLSSSYLKRIFKEQTGETISYYLNHYRLETAKHLLQTSDVQLKDLVQRIGYYDVSSFIRKFKQAMNMTPGEYRRMYIDQEPEARSE